MKNLMTIAACLLISFLTEARTNYIFTPLMTKKVMPENYIHTMTQDHNGFMWMACGDGIHRYDGFENKFYSVPGPRYDKFFINEDGGNTLWILTDDNTFVYDRQCDSITADINRFLLEAPSRNSLKVVRVDHDGNIWYVKSGQLLHLDVKTRRKTIFKGIDCDDILSLECRGNTAFVLTGGGRLKKINLQMKNWREMPAVALSNHPHHQLYLDFSGTLWLFSPHSSTDVLRFFDEDCSRLRQFHDNDGRTFTFVTCVLDDGKGNLWIGTDNAGILIYSKKEGSYCRIKYDSQNNYSIPSDHINCFFLDRRENMWVGTTKRGVAFTSLNSQEFERHSLSQSDDINSIMEDKEGNLWFGTDGNGIYRASDAGTVPVPFPAKLVTCSTMGRDGKLWFGTFGDGIFCQEGNGFRHIENSEEGIDPMKEVRCMTADTFGNVWVGTLLNGLYCIDKEGKKTAYTADNAILQSNSITSLHCPDSQLLYVMTAGGPAIVDTYSREVKALTDNAEIAEKLPLFSTFIFRDSRGFIWLGGEKHLALYLPQSDNLINLSDDYRKHNEFVKAITEDGNRNIWVTTNSGLSQLCVAVNPNDNQPILRRKDYTSHNGLGSVTFNPQSICRRSNGDIIAGGIGGFVSYSPDETIMDHKQPSVLFTSLLIDDRPVGVGEEIDGRVILNKNIELLDGITLDYAHNSFSLYVSGMDYSDAHRQVMAYRLHDAGEWVELTGNKISFSKLAPGAYNLQVKVYEDAPDKGAVSNLKINIQPPVWQSSTAYVVYGILVLMAVGGFIAYTRRKAESKLKMQEMEINYAKQKELEESQMQFFTNISHDLRTPLSLILLPLDKLISSGNLDSDTKEQLGIMRRNADILLTEVNQLLDLRKLDKGKAELKATRGDITAFVRDICSTFEPFSKNMAVELRLDLPDEPIILDFDRNKIQRIVMNLLSNAYKFNRENGSITIGLKRVTVDSREMVRLSVADTGVGISDYGKSHIFERFYQETQKTDQIGSGIGLHIVKEYVAMHGGTIEVADNEPSGTVFTIDIPLEHRDETSESQASVPPRDSLLSENDRLPILVVDDNDDFRQFIVSCLKDIYPVVSASNGKEALDILRSQPVGMVISDVMMPVMDGLELCNKIKSDITISHIPVILLTAKAADEHVVSGLREGADEYITKPFNLDILLLRIKHLLDNKEVGQHKFKTIEVKPSEITVSTLDEKLIDRAISIVEKNMDNSEFSVEQLGEHVGLSRSHLYRKIMAITGMTPLEFIHSIRVKRGKQLLEQGQYPVSEVAFMVGLSPKQFSKYFKDTFGMLPSDFKRKT